MPKTRPVIALVGRRNAAARAARTLGLRPVRVNPESVAPNGGIVVSGESAVCDDALAVVAVTEGAVSAAARLRGRLGLPGLDVRRARQCTDKLAMKRVIHAAGIPCARFVPVQGDVDSSDLIARLGLPLVLKPRIGSGGRGARLVRDRSGLPNYLDGEWMAESFVDGVEMSIETIVVAGRAMFENVTDYVEPRWANVVPAGLDTTVRRTVSQLNQKVLDALGIERGMTHMEFFLTPDGPVFGEVAARPPGGHIMRLLELAYGFDPWEMLLTVELGRTLPEMPVAQTFAGVRYVHPGPGVVRSVAGIEQARAIDGLVELHCKLQPGDHVNERDGSGQHRGYALLAGSEDTVRKGLKLVTATIVVAMDPVPG